MTIHRDRNIFEISREENLKYLDGKIHHETFLLTKEECSEEKTIKLMVDELIEHGKDENQIRQISEISKLLAEDLGFDDTYCIKLEEASKIYDIGNIAIAEEIYFKDEVLTFSEFEVVKNHTLMGYDFLIQYDFSITRLAAIISAEHHEWWNGSGYPKQLKEIEINTASRIVGLADTIAALFSKRPGRPPWDYVQILKYVETRKGLQFDPIIVEVFMKNKAKIYHILSNKYGTYGR
jgi:response regulator RpfG family c-di-GMP phosphodiesterase